MRPPGPSGGPNYNQFSDDVLYEVHVTRGAQSLEDVITYQIRFQSTAFPHVDPADLKAPLGECTITLTGADAGRQIVVRCGEGRDGGT